MYELNLNHNVHLKNYKKYFSESKIPVSGSPSSHKAPYHPDPAPRSLNRNEAIGTPTFNIPSFIIAIDQYSVFHFKTQTD